MISLLSGAKERLARWWLLRILIEVGSGWVAVLRATGLVSDIGFQDLVTGHRWIILGASLALVLVGELGHWAWRTCREVRTLRSQIIDVHGLLDSAKQQSERYEHLVEQYENQQHPFDELKRRATYNLKESEWAQKGACVVELIVEDGSGLESLDYDRQARERITVHINLGLEDGVLPRMVFNVVNKVDPSREYGRIAVDETRPNGARCRIERIGDPAFWAEALDAMHSTRARALGASSNEIRPAEPLHGLDLDTVNELLRLIRRIEGTH